MRRPGLLPLCALFLWALSGAGCRSESPVAGTSINEGNSLSGLVRDTEGMAVSGARVELIPAGHVPFDESHIQSLRRTVTDARGRFEFLRVAPGSYAVEAARPSDSVSSRTSGIAVEERKSIMLPDAGLSPPGKVRLALAGLHAEAGGRIYIPGSSRYAVLDSLALASGSVELGNVPAGSYLPLAYAAPGNSFLPVPASDTFSVASGRRTDLSALSAWAYELPLAVNTTASGAGVAETVAAFPLLIRLDRSRFDFSRARGDGSDIRFARLGEDILLPHEIVTWDSAAGSAEIWVLLDSIPGNNDKPTFRMLSGHGSLASPEGSGTAAGNAVGSGSGFLGWWRLDESPRGPTGDSAGRARDSGPHGIAGTTRGGMGAGDAAEGISGRAWQFDGSDDFVDLGDPPQAALTNRFTFSAWAYMDWDRPDTSVYDMILDKYRYNGNLEIGYTFYLFEGRLRVTLYPGTGGETSLRTEPLTGIGWKFLAATYDGATIRLYENGSEVANLPAVTACALSPANLNLGRREGSLTTPVLHHNFRGRLDEVTMAGAARSPAWLKLSYESQKPGSRVVTGP